MATGFEKFRQKALAEEPIRIEQPQVEETEVKEERREEPVRRSRSERPAAPASAAPATEKPARGRRRKERVICCTSPRGVCSNCLYSTFCPSTSRSARHRKNRTEFAC